MEFRNGFGDLNSFILDSLRGLDETIQYRQGEKRRKEMAERSDRLGEVQRGLNRLEASQRSVTNLMILLFSFAMLFLMIALRQEGKRRSYRHVSGNHCHDGLLRPGDSPCQPVQ